MRLRSSVSIAVAQPPNFLAVLGCLFVGLQSAIENGHDPGPSANHQFDCDDVGIIMCRRFLCHRELNWCPGAKVQLLDSEMDGNNFADSHGGERLGGAGRCPLRTSLSDLDAAKNTSMTRMLARRPCHQGCGRRRPRAVAASAGLPARHRRLSGFPA